MNSVRKYFVAGLRLTFCVLNRDKVLAEDIIYFELDEKEAL